MFVKAFNISQVERKEFTDNLIEASAPRFDFYFLVILSTLIVSLGLLAENFVLIIGGMLVAPLLSPILAIALGITIGNMKVVLRSVKVLGIALILAVIVSFAVGILSDFEGSTVELIPLMNSPWNILFIAFVAGIAASYTWVKPSLDSGLSGVAITVTLIPPLTSIGLYAAGGNWITINNMAYILLVNVLGIILASVIVFTVLDFYKVKSKIIAKVEKEEKDAEKAKKIVKL